MSRPVLRSRAIAAAGGRAFALVSFTVIGWQVAPGGLAACDLSNRIAHKTPLRKQRGFCYARSAFGC